MEIETVASRVQTDHSMTADLQTEVKSEIDRLRSESNRLRSEVERLCSEVERLRSESDMLHNIIALMPCHVYWVGKDGRYLGCNDIQAKSAGLKCRQDIVGKMNADLPWNYHFKTLPESLDNIHDRVLKTGETIIAEEPGVFSNGVRKTFLSTKAPLRNPQGNVIGMVGISIDITERKDAEKVCALAMRQAAAAHEVQTTFLSNMRQDIRTPMSGIVETAKKLQHTNDPIAIEPLSRELAASGQEFLHFLDELLESAHLGAGARPVLQQKFSLKSLIANVVDMNKPKARAKKLLILNRGFNLPHYVIGDPIRIYRIVLELLINALKVTERGIVEITATLLKQQDSKAVIEIVVQDTGPGVPEDKQEFLFTRAFNRIMPSYQRSYQGGGLGLFLIKQFVEDIQGEIYYEPGTIIAGKDASPCGAKFVCLLPLRIALMADPYGEDRKSHYREWARSLADETVTA